MAGFGREEGGELGKIGRKSGGLTRQAQRRLSTHVSRSTGRIRIPQAAILLDFRPSIRQIKYLAHRLAGGKAAAPLLGVKIVHGQIER